jgi:hypothetical protein
MAKGASIGMLDQRRLPWVKARAPVAVDFDCRRHNCVCPVIRCLPAANAANCDASTRNEKLRRRILSDRWEASGKPNVDREREPRSNNFCKMIAISFGNACHEGLHQALKGLLVGPSPPHWAPTKEDHRARPFRANADQREHATKISLRGREPGKVAYVSIIGSKLPKIGGGLGESQSKTRTATCRLVEHYRTEPLFDRSGEVTGFFGFWRFGHEQ